MRVIQFHWKPILSLSFSFLAFFAIFLGIFINYAPIGIAAGYPELVSVASDGTQGNDFSEGPSISADGRYYAFSSNASNLITGDTNGAIDIFVHDRQTGTTERVSVASDGTQGNDRSDAPDLSADGRYVVFMSYASNLVADDTNGTVDVFVHDRQTGTTERMSVASDGTQGNGDSTYEYTSISANGEYVVFQSDANNLVANDTNGKSDIFVHNLITGTTERVSVASDGTQGNAGSNMPSISSDGRYVAFTSISSNLVAGDTNGMGDIFVHDRQTGTTEKITVVPAGARGAVNRNFGTALSSDGRYVAFTSSSSLVAGYTGGGDEVFVYDRQTGTTEIVSIASDGTQANNNSYHPSTSADGRYVVFGSFASNLVAGDTNGIEDVFVHDRQTGTTERVSVASDGTQGNNYSSSDKVVISNDGLFIGFFSAASNLVAGDINNTEDTFITVNPLFSNSTPTPTPSGQILGDNIIESQSDTNDSGFMNGTRFTVGVVGGNVQSMSVYVGDVDSAPNNQYQMAIYTNKTNGKPGTVIAQTSSGTLTANSWNTLPVSATLSANTTYWLMYNTNATQNSLNNMRYIDDEPNIGTYAERTFGTWPATYPTYPTMTTQKFSIYVSFLPDSPVPPAPTVLAGDNTIGSNQDSNSGGSAEAFQYTAVTSGTANKLDVYLNSNNQASGVRVGVYTDNNDSPGTLLSQAVITTPINGTWNTVTLPETTITAGTKYWIAIMSPQGSGIVRFRDKTSGGPASVSSSQSNLTTLPGIWTTGSTWTTTSLSAYIY